MSEQTRDIDYDLASLSLREPFVEGVASEEQRVAIDRRWQIVTEAARRAILGEDSVAEVAAHHVTTGLSEQTPKHFIQDITAASSAVAKTKRRAGAMLDNHLELPSIPEEYIPYGIKQWGPYPTQDEARKALETAQPWAYEYELGRIRQRSEKKGLTSEEGALVTDRYRRARDVKVLAMIAEFAKEKPVFAERDGLAVAVLESGMQVAFTAEALAADPKLTDPSEWRARRQIKDRVYEVTVGDKNYILKEKKTDRHTDVFIDYETDTVGRESNSSKDEFEIAREFSSRGTSHDDELTLDWEKPVGFAVLPDDYQFSLYEKIEGAADYNMATLRDIARAIAARPLAYSNEMQHTKAAIGTLVAESKGRFVLEPGSELGIGDFADAKADAVMSKAERLVRKSVLRAGYIDEDHNAFMIKTMSPADPAEPLEISLIGMDYEFFVKDPERSGILLRQMNEEESGGAYIQRFLDTRKNEDGVYQLTMEDAARLALYINMGWRLPR
jgi:hypothetical protein